MQNNTKKEIHVLDTIKVLVDARWLIARNFVITVVVVALLSFLLPRKYTAVTTLMPPQEMDKMSMNKILADASLPGLGLALGESSSSEILIEILKSRSVIENVLERRVKANKDSIALYKYLGARNSRQAVTKLRDMSAFAVSKSGMITIMVTMGSAKMSAEVANAYVDELDRINQEKSVSRAKNSRVYLESQLLETNTKLDEATRALAQFQQENKAVDLSEQMAASIQQAGEIKGRIIAKEVEIGVMLQTMRPENPLVIRAQKELEELNRRYHELQFGDSQVRSGETDFYMPFTDVPEVGLELAKLTRNVKIQETVWQLLNQQYYQAKIDEARDTPTVQVLDVAVPPIAPSKPRKSVLVVAMGIASIMVTVMWVFVLNFIRQMEKNPADYTRLQYILNQLQNDWYRLRSGLRRK